jgi:uncharacterized membrane protein
MISMGDIVGTILFALGVVIGLPTLIAANLYSRIRGLRDEVEDLHLRLRRLEAGDAPVARPVVHAAPVVHATPIVHEAPVVQAADLPPEGGSSLQIPIEQQPVAPEESLESRIGGRWLLNIGIAAIVIGVAYFEKLAIDNHWINETARVIQGGIVGAALIYAGAWFVRKGYALYGQMLTGGGVAVLYVSTYAAFIFYHLIGRPVAFTLMVAITALGAWLADRHASQGLAVLAVGGGFITPLLLHGNTDMQVALFTYVAIMVAGTVFLAQRREWPLLNLVSYLFTLLLVAAWADRFYASTKYLTTEIYLTIFCAMFVAIAARMRRSPNTFAEFAAWFLWTVAPAYYVASLTVLADHSMAMLIWLIGVALISGVLSVVAEGGAELVVWLAAALPLLGWVDLHASPVWLTAGLVTIVAMYGIALAAQLRQAGTGHAPTAVHIVWMHLSALLMYAAAYFLLEPIRLAATAPVAAGFAVWQGALSLLFWTRDRDRAVHFAALGFTLLSIAIALQFDGAAVTIGWAAEGAAVIALGLVVRRDWMRAGGALLFGIALVLTLDRLLSVAPANHVVLFNPRAACALTVIALAYVIAWLHQRDADVSARSPVIGACIVIAQIVSLVLLTTEINAYFAIREGAFTRELLVSVTWAVYATVLIVIGLQRRYALIRYFAIGLFGITIAKVFFSDLAELQRIYRVASVIALGVMLLLTSYLYQRTRGTELGNNATQ